MLLKRLSVNRVRAVNQIVLHSGSAAAEKAWACWPQSRRVSQEAWIAACSMSAMARSGP